MKWLWCFWLQGMAFVAFAAGPPLEKLGEPLVGNNLEVTWALPTNSLPTVLNVYETVPAQFSGEVISNLSAIANLTSKDKKRPIQDGVFAGKDVLYFGSRDGTKSLGLVPSQGFIVLQNTLAVAQGIERSQAVPTEQEALLRVLELLPKIGIDKRQLAHKTSTTNLMASYAKTTIDRFDKTTGKRVSDVASLGVILYRAIDGFPVKGVNSISVAFGNNAAIAGLECTWRNLQLHHKAKTLNLEAVVESITSGKAFSAFEQSAAFTRLIITKAQVCYYETDGTEAQKFLHPFLQLEAKTNAGNSDGGLVYLYCPIIAEQLKP